MKKSIIIIAVLWVSFVTTASLAFSGEPLIQFKVGEFNVGKTCECELYVGIDQVPEHVPYFGWKTQYWVGRWNVLGRIFPSGEWDGITYDGRFLYDPRLTAWWHSFSTEPAMTLRQTVERCEVYTIRCKLGSINGLDFGYSITTWSEKPYGSGIGSGSFFELVD